MTSLKIKWFNENQKLHPRFHYWQNVEYYSVPVCLSNFIQFCNCLHVATWCNGIPIKVATYKWFYFIFIIIWHTSKEERVLHEFIWCRYHAVQVSVPSFTFIWYYLSLNSKHVPWHVGFIAKSSQYLFCTVVFSHKRSSVTTSLFLYKKNQVFSKHWNDI